MTEFGHAGPYRDRKGCNLVDFAMSGVMITSGFPGNVPCLLPGSPAYDAASMTIAISIVAALYIRDMTGQGQYVETSVHQSSRLGLYPWVVPSYCYQSVMSDPTAARETRIGASIYPVYPCKDGFIRVVALTPRQWDALVRALGSPEVLLLPEWRDFLYRVGNAEDLYALMLEFTGSMTMRELFEAGRREGVPIAPILDMASFYNSPHTKAREFFVEVEHPTVGKAEYAGPPYRWTETPAGIRRPAARLGEHNEEIYCEELGYSKSDLGVLRGAGVL